MPTNQEPTEPAEWKTVFMLHPPNTPEPTPRR